MPQVFCIPSASLELNVASFTEKSSVEVPLIYAHSIEKNGGLHNVIDMK